MTKPKQYSGSLISCILFACTQVPVHPLQTARCLVRANVAGSRFSRLWAICLGASRISLIVVCWCYTWRSGKKTKLIFFHPRHCDVIVLSFQSKVHIYLCHINLGNLGNLTIKRWVFSREMFTCLLVIYFCYRWKIAFFFMSTLTVFTAYLHLHEHNITVLICYVLSTFFNTAAQRTCCQVQCAKMICPHKWILQFRTALSSVCVLNVNV